VKIGDLVTVRLGELCVERLGPHKGGVIPNPDLRYTKGIVLDCLEMGDGFYSYEVLFDEMVEWFSDLELEVFNESR
jgi:hypothetical protein